MVGILERLMKYFKRQSLLTHVPIYFVIIYFHFIYVILESFYSRCRTISKTLSKSGMEALVINRLQRLTLLTKKAT